MFSVVALIHRVVNSGQLLVLRVAGFLLPCYIIVWAIGIWQRRRQRQVSGEISENILIRSLGLASGTTKHFSSCWKIKLETRCIEGYMFFISKELLAGS